MTYRNNLEKYKEYNKESNKRILSIFIPLTIIAIVPVYISIYKEEKALLILLLTLLCITISSFIGFYIGSRKSKKIYESTELAIKDGIIKYSDIEKSIEFPTNEIKSIYIDKFGNLSIVGNNGESFNICNYILNYNELVSEIEEFFVIKDGKSYLKIINNLPLIFFFGVMTSRYIPYLQFYIFFGIGYILLTIWSVLTNFKSIVKKPFLIVLNGTLLYICYIVGKAIYAIVKT